MESYLQKQFRRHNRRVIRSICKAITSPAHAEVDHVDPDVLASLPIRISSLQFFADTVIDSEPRFTHPAAAESIDGMFPDVFDEDGLLYFRPYPLRKKERTSDDDHISDEYCHGVSLVVRDPGTKQRWVPSDMTFNKYGSRKLSGPSEGGCIPWWSTYSFYGWYSFRDDECLPHMFCLLRHTVPFDDRVLRSELVCIASVMKNRMYGAYRKTHRLFPFFCYTFNGPCVRITQAHFDGQYLQLRRTEPVELAPDDKDRSAFKMLLRWLRAKPINNTRWATNQDSADEEWETEMKPPMSPPMICAEAS